ncbi:3-phenylpropionate MFS transporter [Salipaludibacillus sp. LMS25]|jgi:PPP family 3-phenylpropionic acid transporter|uniref:3-phenylpropionate MFS transporter n=1 Tax=Salipaludibacillus sp. LMS25 TaxID=2924031 RepID=UPI0020D13A15|nr:3-phenylpropionate MFS transporter [Salipaludibacillus sp. LMS25]UTR16383.1 3-phenylpropionate MFS transporter [Salipaludibacillus sp. LMS25]
MKNQRWLSLNFFTFFITYGIYLPYWTGWLVKGKGLSVAEASLIMGFGLLARGLSSLFAFPLASKYWSSQRIILVFTVSSLVATLLYIPSLSFSTLFIVTVIFSAIYPSLLPAIDSTAGALVQKGNIHYGKSRAYGSIGFIISVLIISIVTNFFGEQAILWSMIVGLSLMLLLRFLSTPDLLKVKPTTKERKESLTIRNLWKVKSFPIVLLIVVLLQGSHASYYNFGYIYLQALGAERYYIGMIINVAVIFEILYFLKADHFFKKWQSSSLLLLAASGSTLRWLLLSLIPNVYVFVLSQSLHALSFGVAHYAYIRYITKNLPKQQIPNAQGIYSAVALSFSTAVLTLAGGFLYDFSSRLAFLAMIVCTVPAILIIMMTKKHYEY